MPLVILKASYLPPPISFTDRRVLAYLAVPHRKAAPCLINLSAALWNFLSFTTFKLQIHFLEAYENESKLVPPNVSNLTKEITCLSKALAHRSYKLKNSLFTKHAPSSHRPYVRADSICTILTPPTNILPEKVRDTHWDHLCNYGLGMLSVQILSFKL